MAKITKARATTLRVRESAQQIWLAGLGAFALAEEQGGKLFDSLVKKGHAVEKLNKARLQKVLGRADQIRNRAGRAFEKLTPSFPSGMTLALHRFGIPSRKEIVTLTKRVEELTKSVERTRGKAAKAHKPVATAV